MKVSEITVEHVAEFLRLDDASDTSLIPRMVAAKQYIMDNTGLSEGDLDEHEDFYYAYMILVQGMYDNRSMYVEKENVNQVVDNILFRHRRNFL